MKLNDLSLGGKYLNFIIFVAELGRVVSHFDSHGCNTTGHCNSGIYFEIR